MNTVVTDTAVGSDDADLREFVEAEAQRPRMKMPRRARRGTLAQVALGVLVTTAVTAGAFQAYNGIRSSMKAGEAAEMIRKAQMIIEEAHGFGGTYANSSLTVFLGGKGFSADRVQRVSKGTYNFWSPWESSITITGNGGRNFTIVIPNTPKDACDRILTMYIDPSAGLEHLTVGTTSGIVLPLTPAIIASHCDVDDQALRLTF